MSTNYNENPMIVTLMKSEEQWIEMGYFVKNIEHLKTKMSDQKFFRFWPQLFCSRANIERGLQDIYVDYSNLRDDMMFLGLHDDENERKENKENSNEIDEKKFEKEIYFVSNDYKYANRRNEKHYFRVKNELINFLVTSIDEENNNNKAMKSYKKKQLQHSNVTLNTNVQRRQVNIIAKLVYFHHNTHIFGW